MADRNRKDLIRKLRKLFGSSVLVLSALVIVSCSLIPGVLTGSQDQTDPEFLPREILVPVTRGPIGNSISFVGNLQYSQSASLTWKTSGVIGEVRVKVGDQVKKGDVLAVLETDSLQPSVILAEKTMIEQQENLEDIKGSASPAMEAYVNLNAKESALKKAKLEQEALYYPRATHEEMERAWDSLALANLNFNYAKQDYDYLVSINEPWEGFEEGHTVVVGGWRIRPGRYGQISIARDGPVQTYITGEDSRSGRERKFEEYVSTYNTLVSAYEKYLWVTGEPSATDYAVAEGNVRVAQMEYDKALEEYLSYENMPREKDIHAAEVSLNNAETNYNKRFITAQFDGTVTSVSAVEGYYVSQGDAAFRLDDMSRIFIPVSIPELDISSVSAIDSVSITVDAISGKTYKGHFYAIADASESSGNTTSFSAVVEVDEPDKQMLAGMTAEIAIALNKKENAVLIPNAAVTFSNGKPYVTVVSGDTRQTLEIQLGTVTDSISEVTSGNLREGSQLLVSSITPEIMTQLGLDPSAVLSPGGPIPGPSQQGRQEAPEQRKTIPAGAVITTTVPVPTMTPANTDPSGSAAAPSETGAPSSTEWPAPEGSRNGGPFNGGQMPPAGMDGTFIPPENMGMRDGRNFQRPEMNSDSSSGWSERQPRPGTETTPTPAADPAAIPSEKG